MLHGGCLRAGVGVVVLAGLGVVVCSNRRIATVISVSGTWIAFVRLRQSRARTGTDSVSDTPGLPAYLSTPMAAMPWLIMRSRLSLLVTHGFLVHPTM